MVKVRFLMVSDRYRHLQPRAAKPQIEISGPCKQRKRRRRRRKGIRFRRRRKAESDAAVVGFLLANLATAVPVAPSVGSLIRL